VLAWMHDFRDCACTYWASNHPDIVLPEATVGGGDNPSTANPASETRIDWLRGCWPARTAAAEGTRARIVRRSSIITRSINGGRILHRADGREVSRTFKRGRSKRGDVDTPDKLAELVKLAELDTWWRWNTVCDVLGKNPLT